MKKIVKLMAVILLLYSCAKDDSTMIYPEQNPDFSFITIKSPTEVISVDFGEEFLFTPEITQKIEKKSLEYFWSTNKREKGEFQEIEYIGDSTATLKHRFTKSGEYRVRLEVKNEDYSAFKEWIVNVRIYDEGLFILGKNNVGETNYAFARKLSETDIHEGKVLTFTQNILQEINSTIDLKDIIKIQKTVMGFGLGLPNCLQIVTKTKIYTAYHDTFQIFKFVDLSKKYPGREIIDISASAHSMDMIIVLDNGQCVRYNPGETMLFETPKDYNFGDKCYTCLFAPQYNWGSSTDNRTIWVDYDESKIWTSITSHNGGSPVNNTMGSAPAFAENVQENVMKDYDIINIGRMNGNSYYSGNNRFYVIATAKRDQNTIRVVEYTFPNKKPILHTAIMNYTASTPITLTKESKLVANGRFNSMYYSAGSKIYCWYPKNSSPNDQFPVNSSIDLGDGKEVTTMAVSFDMKELYVGFYDVNHGGEYKGGLYIYDAAKIGTVTNLQPSKKFEGVTYRPIQVGYKTLYGDWYDYTN